MNLKKHSILFCLVLTATVLYAKPRKSHRNIAMENSTYEVVYNATSSALEITEKASGEVLSFSPTFYVARNLEKPAVKQEKIAEDFNYKTLSVNGSTDYLSDAVGEFYLLTPTAAKGKENTITFAYEAQEGFNFSAIFTLPTSGASEPQLAASLIPTIDAYFSIGYYGAPSYGIEEVSEIFQPLPFTEKRFPVASYLTPAFLATLPATLATIDEVTYGVVVDASELPYNPMPVNVARSPFGVAIRDKEGAVRPMVWALIMGNKESMIKAGTTYDFNYRLYLSKRNLSSAYEDIARRLYGFKDMRHNDLGSLNTAFENMVEFAMGEWGRYLEDMKGYSYETDIPNSVKNTSSLPIYTISYIVDDSTMFLDRGVPITEFLLSRENFCYAKDMTTGTGQMAYNNLGNPCMTASESLGYYNLSGQDANAFLQVANEHPVTSPNLANEKKWRENMARYKVTGEQKYLDDVIAGADKYIAERIDVMQTGFNYLNHAKSSFWSALAPRFWELYETYKLTEDSRYLEAARVAARSYAYHLWFAPAIPDEMVTCNEGGVPTYRGAHSPYAIPVEDAPAWRLSCMGLSCECGGTSTSKHRGIFMANHAPYFMRIGALTGDTFLTEIAKTAIIGRWTSFPGYHINTDRNTAYEKVPFAHRSLDDLKKTSSMHYSHVWPMIALTLDYLVSDAYAKSSGAINFPSTFIENTANLYNNLYFQEGTFYGEEDVTLWMPRALVSCDNKELNYIVARGNGKLYIAFVNQSDETVEDATVILNNDYVKLTKNSAQVWSDSQEASPIQVTHNKFKVDVSPNGITAIAINDVAVATKFQEKLLADTEKSNNWGDTYQQLDNVNARAMVLGFSSNYTRLYAYSEERKGELESVQFDIYFDGELYETVTETTYPFEYANWVPSSVDTIRLVVTTSKGDTEEVLYNREQE